MIDEILPIKKNADFLENHLALYSKVSFTELVAFTALKRSIRDFLLEIQSLQFVSDQENITIKALREVVKTLETLKEKSRSLGKMISSLATFVEELIQLARDSTNLLSEHQLVGDIDPGFFGTSDHISRRMIEFESLYAFDENYFSIFLERLVILTSKLQSSGVASVDIDAKSLKIMEHLETMIELALYTSKSYMPNAVFFSPPSAFLAFKKVAGKIINRVAFVDFGEKLVQLESELDDTIRDLRKTLTKHSDEPQKELSLSGLFKKSGISDLKSFLSKTEKYLKRLGG